MAISAVQFLLGLPLLPSTGSAAFVDVQDMTVHGVFLNNTNSSQDMLPDGTYVNGS